MYPNTAAVAHSTRHRLNYRIGHQCSSSISVNPFSIAACSHAAAMSSAPSAFCSRRTTDADNSSDRSRKTSARCRFHLCFGIHVLYPS